MTYSISMTLIILAVAFLINFLIWFEGNRTKRKVKKMLISYSETKNTEHLVALYNYVK